jgi:glycosyltransferase involved in cell wall biosynthesis
VLAQTMDDIEVIVVNDGSADEHRDAYGVVLAAAASRIGDRLKAHWLIRRPKGHGQSYSLNYGVAQATGEFVCFLDDDDVWTDTGHLARARQAIEAAGRDVGLPDLYMANQRAYLRDEKLAGPIWIDTLAEEIAGRGVRPRSDGSFVVSIGDLMATHGFCHINCLTVRRSLYDAVGGMDEGIRWECDRDLFLRLIDRAGVMLHHPEVVSRHNVPDPAKSLNMTTAISMLEKRLLQVRVLDKAALFAGSASIRAHGRRHKAFAMKKIAEELARAGQWVSAAYYAREALGAAPTAKWLLFSAYCQWRRLINGDKGKTEA